MPHSPRDVCIIGSFRDVSRRWSARFADAICWLDSVHLCERGGPVVKERSGYVTVPEAARRLNTTPQTISRWCRAGKLEAIKIGKEWRIPLAQPALRPQSDGLGTLEDVFSSLLGRQEH